MYTFKHILLPTDLSPNSEAAVPFAVALAKQSGATIHLFHAFEDEAGKALASGILIGASAWLASVHKQREQKLRDFATNLATRTELDITHTCVHGHPAVEAVKFAAKIHADLIVISTHGRTGIPHLFLGSIAERILRLSPVPVLTVRPGENVPAVLRTILVPTDFSENANAAIPYAVELAKQHGAKLILAHVVENSTYYSDSTWSEGIGPDVEQWMEAIKAQGEKKLAETAARLALEHDLVVTTELKCGNAHAKICAIAEKHKADLMVLSTHGYTGFSHLAHGSVAERVLRSCSMPMLSIRPSKLTTKE